MAYIIDPTNPASPADSDGAAFGAGEFRALKGYIQGLISGGSSFKGYAWQGFRNKVINGNFDVWQVGTSLGAGTGTRYLADQFNTTSVGTTNAPSRQAFALGQTIVPYEPSYFHRTVVASVAGASNFCYLQQPLESVRQFAGQVCALTFYAKADAAKPMAFELSQNFGTGGSPSAAVTNIGTQKINLTTTFQKFVFPVTVPSIAGKTLGSNNDDFLGLQFWFDAGSTFNSRTGVLGQQSGTFDIAQVQLEPISDTPFELLPPEVTLLRCQRYWRSILWTDSFVATAGTQDVYTTVNFHPQMRKVPIVTQVAGTFTNATTPNAPAATIADYTNFARSAAAGTAFAQVTAQLDARF